MFAVNTLAKADTLIVELKEETMFELKMFAKVCTKSVEMLAPVLTFRF